MDEAYVAQVREQYPEFHEGLEVARRARTVIVGDESEDIVSLSFDFKRGFQKRDGASKRAAINAAATTLVSLCNTYSEVGDPLLLASIGSDRRAEGRLPMLLELRWPGTTDTELRKLATKRMREVASDLRYASDVPRRDRLDMIYAQVERARGITLETNSIGSCSIGSDGSYYRSEEPIIKLLAHNMYSRQQQIICLSGAIAIAHADELVKG